MKHYTRTNLIKRERGSAAVEFAWLLPFFLLILVSLFRIFSLTTEIRKEGIAAHTGETLRLRKDEMRLSALERPCLAHPLICRGRKK